MPRKDLLPSYLSGPAWVALCDAIDQVFANAVDTPTDTLGKLREAWHFNATTDAKVNAGQLVPSSDLDVFERDVLVRQLNMLGYAIRNPKGLTDAQLTRLVQGIPFYWYSKGKKDLANFLGYTLDSTVDMHQMWTEDYKTFYPEGDPMIGLSIYNGGTWYPTTHTTVEVDILSFSEDLDLDAFAELFTDIANYPLVLSYIVATSDLHLSTESGAFLPVVLGEVEENLDILANYVLTPGEVSTENGGGRFTPIRYTAIAGEGGKDFVPPPPIIANFVVDKESGPAPLTVSFKNMTTGPASMWQWFFEGVDTPQSTERDPTYTFLTPGTYSIRMRASGLYGVGTTDRVDLITVL